MSTIYINIGSNQGHRHALIEQAVALIIKHFPEATVRRSDYIESEPWGYVSVHNFLNLGVAIDLDYMPDPLQVLDTMQHIEQVVGTMPHRNADGSYRDRDIDIDIIAIDDITYDHPRLQLPHPRAAERPFVMIPLGQLKKS